MYILYKNFFILSIGNNLASPIPALLEKYEKFWYNIIVLKMRRIDKLTSKELAKRLEIEENTVINHFNRLKQSQERIGVFLTRKKISPKNYEYNIYGGKSNDYN